MARKLETGETIIIDGNTDPLGDGESLNTNPIQQRSDSLEVDAAQDWLAANQEAGINFGVYRHSAGNRALAFMFDFQPSEFTIDTLQSYLKENYGGGDYRVQGRLNGKLKVNKALSIDGDKLSDKNGVSELREIILNQSAGKNDSFAMMQMMIDNQRQMQAEQMRIVSEQRNQTMQVLGIVAPLVIPLIGKMLEGKKEPSFLEQLAQFKTLSPERDPMEMFIKGMELTKNDSGEDSSNLNDLLISLADNFGGPLATMAANQKTEPNQSAPAPSEKVYINDVENNTNSEALKMENLNEQNRRIAEMRGHVARLLELASKGKTVDEVHGIIDLLLNDDQYIELVEFLNHEKWYEALEGFNPQVNDYKDWFILLRESILSSVSYENEGDLTEGTEPAINDDSLNNDQSLSEHGDIRDDNFDIFENGLDHDEDNSATS